MPIYEYEKGMADLQDKYAQDDATNQYARFISKQRYSRQRQDNDTSFTRNFPKFTGQWAQRLGSGIQSGVFQSKLQENVGDFNMAQDRLNQDEAGFDANFAQQQTLGQSAYQKAIMMLTEQMKAQQAQQNPFAAYQAVY